MAQSEEQEAPLSFGPVYLPDETEESERRRVAAVTFEPVVEKELPQWVATHACGECD